MFYCDREIYKRGGTVTIKKELCLWYPEKRANGRNKKELCPLNPKKRANGHNKKELRRQKEKKIVTGHKKPTIKLTKGCRGKSCSL